MKKAILPILASLSILFFSCNNKKKTEAETKDTTEKTGTSTIPAESRSVVGRFKMAEWNDPTILLNAEEKQTLMDSVVIEITSDGKWITRKGAEENSVNYTYYENTRTMNLPDDEGKMQTLKVSFSGNRISLSGDNGSVVLERL